MVAGAQQQPQPQAQQQQQQPVSAEEEALKRNTDCVYFLASPLTCKKGSECEYRHSDYARVNPRDCWYWLNGNCMNPKCAFRHPPLDSLLGTQAAAAPSAGSALSSSHTAVAPVTPATQTSSKQPVPCIYFQKGFCLKGDRCAFLHGPNPSTNVKVTQASPTTHVAEPSNVKKVFGSIQKCTQEQKITQAYMVKSFGGPPVANPVQKVETALPRNEVGNERNAPAIKSFDDQAIRIKAVTAPVMNGISTNRVNHSHLVNISDDHGFRNGKNADEFLRESSPGFDVLVEDELGDQDYFHGEDQYGRSRGHEGRNLNSVDDYDMDQSAEYGSAAEVDRERFRNPRGYESYDHMQGQYAWEQLRASSERIAVGPTQVDRRGYRKSNSPDNTNGSDLRHRLSKQRRGNGLRSVISHDYAHDSHNDDRSYRGSSRRDQRQKPQHEGPLSSRLRGRINFPGGSSVDGGDLRPDREFDRGRSRGRLSPSRPQTSTYQGRVRDRLKGRVQDDHNNEGKIVRDSRTRRDIADGESTDFSGPKSLSQLKGGKDLEFKEQSYLGKRKSMGMEVSQHSEDIVSFEGPKPLSEILKRKREAEAAASGRENTTGETEMQRAQSTLANEEGEDSNALSNKEESKSASADLVATKDEQIVDPHGLPSEAPNVNELEVEDGMIYDETVDDQELEADDQAQGECDYEQGEEEEEEDGEYDGENAEGEEEYLEDEDDDFAKKIGVVLS